MQGCMHARKYIDMAHYFKKKKIWRMMNDIRGQRKTVLASKACMKSEAGFHVKSWPPLWRTPLASAVASWWPSDQSENVIERWPAGPEPKGRPAGPVARELSRPAAVRAACRLPVTRARPGHGNNESERHRELERKLMPMLRA